MILFKAIFYNKELFSALSEATLCKCISYVGAKKLYAWVSTLQDDSFKEKIFLDIMKIFDNKKYGEKLSTTRDFFVVQVLNDLNNKSMVELLIKYITNHMPDKAFIKVIKDNVDKLYRHIHIDNHHRILPDKRLKKSGIKSPLEIKLLVLQGLQTLLQGLITASDKQAGSALPLIAATPNRSIVAAATEESQKRPPGKPKR